MEQLYNPDAPSAGLLALLKFALWQVLWVEPSSGDFPCYISAECICAVMGSSRGANCQVIIVLQAMTDRLSTGTTSKRMLLAYAVLHHASDCI